KLLKWSGPIGQAPGGDPDRLRTVRDTIQFFAGGSQQRDQTCAGWQFEIEVIGPWLFIRMQNGESAGRNKSGRSDPGQSVAGVDGTPLKSDRVRAEVVKLDPIITPFRIGQELVYANVRQRAKRRCFIWPKRSWMTQNRTIVYQADAQSIDHGAVREHICP